MKDRLFSDKERYVLTKFKSWAIVTKEDKIILNRYASIGFVQFGFDWDKMEETAKLTNSGTNHLHR